MNTCFFEAVKAYAKACKNGTPFLFPNGECHNLHYCEPSESLSKIGRKYVYLNNCNGLLARYVIRTKQIII